MFLFFYTEMERAQFWIIILAIAVFGLDVIRRMVFEGKTITSRLLELDEAKAERIALEYLDKTERERIADEVKATLLAQQTEVKQELEKQSRLVEHALEVKQVGFEHQLEKQFEVVEQVLHKNEITTKTDLTSETGKIKQAIDKGTETAVAAYKEANNINKKLARMSEAGLLKLDETKRAEVKEFEEKG